MRKKLTFIAERGVSQGCSLQVEGSTKNLLEDLSVVAITIKAEVNEPIKMEMETVATPLELNGIKPSNVSMMWTDPRDGQKRRIKTIIFEEGDVFSPYHYLQEQVDKAATDAE